MFDKFRENAKYQQVKQHLEANKTTYLIGAGGLVVGVGIGLLLKQRPTQIINMVAPEIKPVFHNNNSSSAVNFGGHMTKLVKCLETGEVWEKVADAAKAVGTTSSTMSKVLNGHTETFDGLHYAIIGMGTSI